MTAHKFTPSEAAAYALAQLELADAHATEFAYMEACGTLEATGVRIVVEAFPDCGEYQVEVCSPVEFEGRDAYALAATADTHFEALKLALQTFFEPDC